MKRFFKPKGKDDKPIPYPLELAAQPSPPAQPYANNAPIYAAYASQQAPGLTPAPGRTDQLPPPGSAGYADVRDGSGSSPASSGTDLAQRPPNAHRHGMLHRKDRGSRDFEGVVAGDPGEQASISRRTSLKGDGKLFGWGRGGKDKERHHKDEGEQEDEKWIAVPNNANSKQSSPIPAIPEQRDSATAQDQAYYALPPGAAPYGAQSMPVARPYVNEPERPRPRQTSGGRDYLSGRPTVPLPSARGPTVSIDTAQTSRPESPYDQSNDRLAPVSPLPLGLSPPMPITRKKAPSAPAPDAWTPANADRDASHGMAAPAPVVADPRVSGPGGYSALPPMPIPKPSPRTRTPTQGSGDLRNPSYPRQRADSNPRDPRRRGDSDPQRDEGAFSQPRAAPAVPHERATDPRGEARLSRDAASDYRAMPPPAVVFRGASSPSLDPEPPSMQSLSISPNASSTHLYEGDKKKDKGRFLNSLGLGKHKDERERDKQQVSAYDSYRPSLDGSRDEHASRDGHGTQDVPAKREKARLEKDKARRDKEDRKEAERIAAADDTVGRAIAELCRRAEGSDVGDILLLCERVAHSPESVAKDAARATRKELKHGSDEMAKVTAAKIWLLGCTNSPERGGFRSYATDKKFMATVQDVLAPPSDKDIPVQTDTYERIRETLAHLVHNFGDQKGCEALKACWLKVRNPAEPLDGYPLPATHPVYSTGDRLQRASPPSETNPTLPPRSRPPPNFANVIPNETQEFERLIRECATAKEHANVLQQALAYAKPAELDGMDVVKEFYASCVADQESLVSQLAWANSQAEKSRISRGVSTPVGANIGDVVPPLDRFGHTQGPGTPLAERAFAQLLEANTELSDAIRTHDDMESMARADREIRIVQERSKHDTRMNRDRYNFTADDDNLVPPRPIAGGSSRSPSPNMFVHNDDNHSVGTHSTSGPRSSYLHDQRLSRELLHPDAIGFHDGQALSRTSTPDSQADVAPPRFPAPARTGSPTRLGHKIQGPRPLAEAMRRGNNSSQSSLRNSQALRGPVLQTLPANGPAPFITGFLIGSDHGHRGSDDGLSSTSPHLSAKGMGKRPQMYTERNSFDPNDMWQNDDRDRDQESEPSSDENFLSMTPPKAHIYAYDAYNDQEARTKLAERQAAEANQARLRVVNPNGPGGAGTLTAMEPVPAPALDAPPRVSLDTQDMPHGLSRKRSQRWKMWQRQ